MAGDYDPFKLREVLLGEGASRRIMRRRRLAWGCFWLTLFGLIVMWGLLLAKMKQAKGW